MKSGHIHKGTAMSLAVFAGSIIVATAAHEAISVSEIATNCLLAATGISILGCAYFLPRSIGLWIRKRP